MADNSRIKAGQREPRKEAKPPRQQGRVAKVDPGVGEALGGRTGKASVDAMLKTHGQKAFDAPDRGKK